MPRFIRVWHGPPWMDRMIDAVRSRGRPKSVVSSAGARQTLRSQMKPPTLLTKRLVLHRWTEGDREALARITTDPEVMRYGLRTLTRKESDDLIDTTETCFDQR